MTIATTPTLDTRGVLVISGEGSAFRDRIATVKRLGGQFDATGKVWVVKFGHQQNVDFAAKYLTGPGYRWLTKQEWVERRENGGR